MTNIDVFELSPVLLPCPTRPPAAALASSDVGIRKSSVSKSPHFDNNGLNVAIDAQLTANADSVTDMRWITTRSHVSSPYRLNATCTKQSLTIVDEQLKSPTLKVATRAHLFLFERFSSLQILGNGRNQIDKSMNMLKLLFMCHNNWKFLRLFNLPFCAKFNIRMTVCEPIVLSIDAPIRPYIIYVNLLLKETLRRR